MVPFRIMNRLVKMNPFPLLILLLDTVLGGGRGWGVEAHASRLIGGKFNAEKDRAPSLAASWTSSRLREMETRRICHGGIRI